MGFLKELRIKSFKYSVGVRDYVNKCIAQLIGISGLTWPDELRVFEELDISFDGAS